VNEAVHIEVRADTCMASGYCMRKAPSVFGADENGWIRLLDAEPVGHTAEVLEAAAMCPVAAIDVFDRDGHQL